MHLKMIPFIASCLIASAADSPAARWEGVVQLPGRTIALLIDLDRDHAGQWIGSAIVPGFSVKGTALKDIVIQEPAVAFAIPGALGAPTLQGNLSPEGALSGEFHQGGNTAPFTLRKAGPPQVEPPKLSTAVRAELEGDWQGDMNFVGRPIHVRLKLTNKDGKALALFQAIGKTERTFPFDFVTQDGEFLTVDSTGTGLRYEGRFRKESNEVKGTFSQGPMEAELVLRRAPAQEKAR